MNKNIMTLDMYFGFKYWSDLNRDHWKNKHDFLMPFRNWSNEAGVYTKSHKFIFHGSKNNSFH